jgi:peptidoglycan hydrolase CwlO-like protein
MISSVKAKGTRFLGILILLIISLFSTSVLAENKDKPSEVQQKISSISEKEKKVLEELFNLTQEIGIAEGEERAIAKEIENIGSEVKTIEAKIREEELAYEKKQEGLNQVMKTYQRMGPGSYLEIVMNSDSLSDFLRRINTLRDLTRNTGKLLEKLDESKKKLALENTKLREKLELVQEKQRQAREMLAKKLKVKQEQEDYLASLKEESKFYRGHLNNIEQMIEELKPFLSKASERFYSITQTGNIPEDALRISFSIPYIRQQLDDKVLNEIVAKQPDFPKMVFTFDTGKTEINFPDKKLILSGSFVVEEGHILKFAVDKGEFYEMPLEARYIEELFSGKPLALDCKPILGGSTIESAETKKGYLELTVKFSLFDLFD